MYSVFAFFTLYSLSNNGVLGHGAMVKPTSWFDYKQIFQNANGTWEYDYIGMSSYYQCVTGCRIPRDLICTDEYSCEGYKSPGCACFWYTNYTKIEKPTIFDPKLRTYDINDPYKRIDHPWRAPGTAPIDSPCGVAGGNFKGCQGGQCNTHKGGFGFGPKAEDVNFSYDFYVSEWHLGSAVEVAWSITANHGGGYSYRLCKMTERSVTEECFQQTPLRFVGDKQWIQYGKDESTRVEIQATRTTQGTYPEGSQWTKNPIPACIGGLGGFYYPTSECPQGTQFKPPRPELYGFGVNSAQTVRSFAFSIVDKVYIPDNLPSGRYVLSFRWDTEQTPQVWNTCASINLV